MSRSYLYYFVNFLVCQWILMTCVWVVGADVLVISRSSNFTVNIFPDLPANFGQILPYEGIRGCVVTANPPHVKQLILLQLIATVLINGLSSLDGLNVILLIKFVQLRMLNMMLQSSTMLDQI